jgi:hypothetical protein
LCYFWLKRRVHKLEILNFSKSSSVASNKFTTSRLFKYFTKTFRNVYGSLAKSIWIFVYIACLIRFLKVKFQVYFSFVSRDRFQLEFNIYLEEFILNKKLKWKKIMNFDEALFQVWERIIFISQTRWILFGKRWMKKTILQNKKISIVN